MKTPTFEQAQEEFVKADADARKYLQLRDATKKIRDALCPHSVMNPKQYYFSGSYYDTAYTEYWHECACCGYTTERKHEQHSWYG